MLTVVETGPEVGVKEDMAGAGKTTVKLVLLDAVMPFAVKDIGPVLAPCCTVACAVLSFKKTKVVASVPLKRTLESPVRYFPLMVTTVPNVPEAGVKLLITGVNGNTTKDDVEYTVKLPTVTVSTPVAAPVGTVATIVVSFRTVKLAGVPKKVT